MKNKCFIILGENGIISKSLGKHLSFKGKTVILFSWEKVREVIYSKKSL